MHVFQDHPGVGAMVDVKRKTEACRGDRNSNCFVQLSPIRPHLAPRGDARSGEVVAPAAKRHQGQSGHKGHIEEQSDKAERVCHVLHMVSYYYN